MADKTVNTVENDMQNYRPLTNDEFVNQLTLRSDLTPLETEMLRRLAELVDANKGLADELEYAGWDL